MKLYKLIIIAFLSLILTQCKSTKQEKIKNVNEEKEMKLEPQGDITVGQVYFQKWVGGREESGSGINIFFPDLINKNNYAISNVYFRNMVGKIMNGKSSYFASLNSASKDIIMSNEPNAEYGNTMPNISGKIQPQLKDNECVISYIVGSETKYCKIENIVEKETQYMPSAPPRNNKD